MYNKFFNIFAVIIICIIPLIITPWEYDYYYMSKIISIIFLCIVCLPFYIKFIKSRKYHIDFSAACCFSCITFLILSTIFSVNFSQSLTGRTLRYEGLLSFFSYYFIFLVSSKTYKFEKWHIILLSISASIIGIYAIFQYFGFDPISKDSIRTFWKTGYAYATLGNPDFLGSYIVLILPIFVFGFIYSNNILYLIPSVILCITLLCTNSRGTWLAFIFSFILILYLSYKSKINIKPCIVTIILFAALISLFDYFKGGTISKRFYSIITDFNSILKAPLKNDQAGSHRMFIWRRAYKLIFKKPLLGSGPDTFDIVFMNLYGKEWYALGNTTIIDKAHNDYMQIAVTCGFPYLISYISLIFYIVCKAMKNYKKNILIVPLICSISGYMIQAFFNISVVSVAPVFWCLLGILFKISKDVFNDSSTHNNIPIIKYN